MYKQIIINALGHYKDKLSYIDNIQFVVDPEDYVSEFKGNQLLAFINRGSSDPIGFRHNGGDEYLKDIYFDMVFTYDPKFDADAVLSNFFDQIPKNIFIISAEVRSDIVYERIYQEGQRDSSDYKMMLISFQSQTILTRDSGCIEDVC